MDSTPVIGFSLLVLSLSPRCFSPGTPVKFLSIKKHPPYFTVVRMRAAIRGGRWHIPEHLQVIYSIKTLTAGLYLKTSKHKNANRFHYFKFSAWTFERKVEIIGQQYYFILRTRRLSEFQIDHY